MLSRIGQVFLTLNIRVVVGTGGRKCVLRIAYDGIKESTLYEALTPGFEFTHQDHQVLDALGECEVRRFLYGLQSIVAGYAENNWPFHMKTLSEQLPQSVQ